MGRAARRQQPVQRRQLSPTSGEVRDRVRQHLGYGRAGGLLRSRLRGHGGNDGRRPAQALTAQHGLMQLLQGGPWLHAQLVDQQLARLAEGVEGLAPPLGAVQGQHQVPDEDLAVRVRRHQGTQLGDQLPVAAQLQVEPDAVLDREKAFLGEPVRGGGDDPPLPDVGIRRPSPQVQRPAQKYPCRCRVAGIAGGTPVADRNFPSTAREISPAPRLPCAGPVVRPAHAARAPRRRRDRPRTSGRSRA